MATLNRKYGYLFLAEPYCASRAVGIALAQQEGSVVLDTWVHNKLSKLVDDGFLTPHEPLFKFSIVRNPADYLVTKYHHLSGWHTKGFAAFLNDEYANRHRSLFWHASDADKTLRYELLESQLNDLLEARGAPPVSLTVVGKTQDKKDWRSYYSDKDLALLRSLPDFNTYGYTT
jgi:hypothetical protein